MKKIITEVKFDKLISEGYEINFIGAGDGLDHNCDKNVDEPIGFVDHEDLFESLGRNRNHQRKH